MEEHPIKVFIDELFASKPEDKRNKWSQYLVDQEIDTVDDMRKLSQE
jgi:hypothetical protein